MNDRGGGPLAFMIPPVSDTHAMQPVPCWYRYRHIGRRPCYHYHYYLMPVTDAQETRTRKKLVPETGTSFWYRTEHVLSDTRIWYQKKIDASLHVIRTRNRYQFFWYQFLVQISWASVIANSDVQVSVQLTTKHEYRFCLPRGNCLPIVWSLAIRETGTTSHSNAAGESLPHGPSLSSLSISSPSCPFPFFLLIHSALKHDRDHPPFAFPISLLLSQLDLMGPEGFVNADVSTKTSALIVFGMTSHFIYGRPME